MKNIKDIALVILTTYLILSIVYIDRLKNQNLIIPTTPTVGEVEREIEDIKTQKIPIKTIKGKDSIIVEKVVDSLYKAKYEKAIKENDSLKAKNLFLESISINKVKDTIDNKDITINSEFTTRGILLDYKLDYKIKNKTKLTYKHPKLSLVVGASLVNNSFDKTDINFSLGLKNKKGNTINFIVGTNNTYGIGYSKTFKLSKN